MRVFGIILLTLTMLAAASPTSAAHLNGRLLTANGPWGLGSYVYDALGNIRSRIEGTNSVSTMTYDASNRVSSATILGQNRAFAYDARGNVTNNGKYAFAYDFANQPVSQSGAVPASYAYDGNLKRVKEVRGGKTVYTVYSRVTGGLVYRDEATDVVKTDYANVGGAALRLKKTGTGAFVPEYTHFDAQGSAVTATGPNGSSVWRERYAPYGEELLNPAGNANNTGYTGHLKDDSTGLTYMQARYYDPIIGRFLSTDPIGYQDQINLYAYVANDPVNKTDPNGEESLCTTCGVGSPLSDKIGSALADIAPVVGDIKGAVEFAQNPSIGGGIGVLVGIAPGGDLLKGPLKQADEVFGALSDGAKMGTDDALNAASAILGDSPAEIASGVFRSGDGNFQVRMTDSDLAGRGTNGQPHMNFESGSTVTDAKGRETFVVDENKHIMLPEEKP